MGLTQNTGLRNLMAAAWGAGFNSGKVNIYTAAKALLLAEVTLPATAFGSPAEGVVNKNGTWQDSSANASGVARVAEFVSEDEAKTAECTVSQTGDGGDLIIDNENVVAGGVTTVTAFSYTHPAS